MHPENELGWGGFFLGIWLIHARIGSARLSDAALIGGAIGVAFLAHPVPAVLLATITTIAACTIQWSSASHVRWFAVACFTALVVGAPFLLPLVVTYHLREVNLAPSHFIG